MAKIRANAHYRPKAANPLDPCDVRAQDQGPDVYRLPVGGRADRWTLPGSGPALHRHEAKWFTFTNGPHIDSLDPYTFDRWFDFLQLFVARQNPGPRGSRRPSTRRRRSSTRRRWGSRGQPAPRSDPDRADVRQPWPLSRSCLRSGSCSTTAPALTRSPTPRRPAIPTPPSRLLQVVPHSRHQGALLVSRRRRHARSPCARDRRAPTTTPPTRRPCRSTDYGHYTETGGLWGNASDWKWKWKQNPSGTAVSYVSAPLKQNTTVIGGGAVHVWVRSSTPDVDLQATVSEVRPDGEGDLRAERLAEGR